MKPINICFVTREYAHPKMGKTGGIGVFLKQFTNQLKHCDFKITVFSFGGNPVRFDDDGVKVVKIKDLGRFNEWVKAPLRRHNIPGYITLKILLEFFNRLYISLYVSLYVLRNRFDLIEFHDYGGDAPYFVGRLPKVVRCHGSALTLHTYMGYVNRVTDSIFEKHFFKRFHKNVIAVSEYAAQTTQEAFKLRTKPSVIYNGVAIPKTQQKPSYLDPPTVPYSVFYFGSIRERKGIDIACTVFNKVIETFPKASFHVLGNNNNDHWNRVCVKLLSESALSATAYYGPISNEQVTPYLEKAHVVLFPSYGENFSIALLEVMALGKIAITSKIPAFEELIVPSKNGFMASTEMEYVDHLSRIFNGQVLVDKISKHAVKIVLEKFSIDHKIKVNVSYYKSLLKNGKFHENN